VEDETITVPAGTYENCEHYQAVMVMVMGEGEKVLRMTAKSEDWFHKKVNGSVKAIEEIEPFQIVGRTIGASTRLTKLLRRYYPGKK